ncbi:KAP family P-loop NTPase fold protein [Leucobacter sp. VD1]|uniref:KAP family P-loop NTPase fold protein n=1 Tax=Leucobacter sp. VD1 TaxID=3080381 RepID=UPI003015A266
MSNTRNPSRGLSDQPRARDQLGLAPYIDGIADFIRGCSTPLTLAIQGDWGSGKTNTMLLIEQALEPTARLSEVRSNEAREALQKPPEIDRPPLYTVSFNTWQYAQFNLDSMLAVAMLRALVTELEKTSPPSDAMTKTKAKLVQLARFSVNTAANVVSNLTFGSGVGEILPTRQDPQHAGDPLLALEMLGELRENLAELVRSAVAHRDGPGRVVIFIDDLDRLNPLRAVELMETLKLFLDLEHCVFVLAIDFDVVAQGVSDKYGADKLGAKKARSFFDKIIQVPFHMPIENYRTDELLDDTYASAGIELSPEQKRHFKALVQSSVSNNPRSIKRLMNTFMLLRGILDTDENHERLFAVLCLQIAYPNLYNDLHSDAFSDALSRVFEQEKGTTALTGALEDELEMDAGSVEATLRLWGLWSIAERRAMQHFATCFRTVFLNQDGGFDRTAFDRTVSLSAITGVGKQASEAGTDDYVWGHKFYRAEERRTEWRDRFGQEPKLADTYRLAERFVSALSEVPLPSEVSLRVGMQVGNTRNWTIECSGKRVGVMHVHQKFFHVYFGPRPWMEWLTEEVRDANGVNDFCMKRIESDEQVDRLAELWKTLFTERIDLESSLEL